MIPRISVLRDGDADASIPLPTYETNGAAGADIRANFPEQDRDAGRVLGPGERGLIPTGTRVAIPEGFEIQVRPRSGLALKQGLTVLNTPGTIDSDYRGPLGVILVNLGDQPVGIGHGDRIAQLVVAPVVQAEFTSVQSLDETDRGAGGFGSTGTT